MLTKLGMMAMTATIGTAAVGGTAKANEPCNDNLNNTRVERGYDHGAPVGVVDVRYDGRNDGRYDNRVDNRFGGRYDNRFDGRYDNRFGAREREFARRRAYEQM